MIEANKTIIVKHRKTIFDIIRSLNKGIYDIIWLTIIHDDCNIFQMNFNVTKELAYQNISCVTVIMTAPIFLTNSIVTNTSATTIASRVKSGLVYLKRGNVMAR